MSDEKEYASPPCYLHELDPDFLAIEEPKVAKPKKPGRPKKAESDES